ncbi:MAG: tetratricopeptide repeat protein [Planctomycetota bacterium]|nr:tetratricopeptide repeat protein [Planctomycetota bacterium]
MTSPGQSPSMSRIRSSRVIVVRALAAFVLCGPMGCELTPKNEVPDAPVPPPPRPAVDVRRPTPEQAIRAEGGRDLIDAGSPEAAIKVFESLLDENPSLTVAYIGIGTAYESMGEAVRAEPAFARAARLEPRNFEAQFGHGQALQALDRFREALRAYQQALVVEPDDTEALSALAATFLELDRARSAIAPAERVVELSPDNGDAFAMLGTAYMLAGRTDEAIDTYEIAIELIGNEPELIGNLIECYASEGRFQESVNAGQVLLSLAPSSPAWERQGRGFFRLGDYEASIDCYRRAVEIDSDYWPALNGIGVNALNTWLASDRSSVEARDEAAAAFRSSLRVNPDQPKVVRLLTTYGL